VKYFGLTAMYKILKRVVTSVVMGFSLFSIAGCDHFSQWANQQEVVLPESPPITTQELVKVASMCRKEVESLEKQSAYVREERKSEYNSVLRMASDNCSELEETLQRMKQATHHKEGFAQNLRHAHSTVVQQGSSSPAIVEENLTEFAEFEPDEASDLQEGPLH
jgi:hypothetical protein